MNHTSDKKTLNYVFAIIVIVFFISIFFIMIFPDLHARSAEYQMKKTGSSTWSVKSLFKEKAGQDTSLRLELPEGLNMSDVVVESNVRKNAVYLTLNGADAAYTHDYRLYGPTGRMRDILFTYEKTGDTFSFLFDRVYEPDVNEEDGWIVVNFRKPRELYKNVVVIDAAGGGDDPGLSSEGVNEKDITLGIVKRIRTRFYDKMPEDTIIYYTRTSDESLSLQERVEIAKKTDATLFLSVGLNSTSSGRSSSMQGAAAEYITVDDENGSKAFATGCLDNMLRKLNCQNRGLIPGDEEALLKNLDMTAVIAKVGYLSNDQEKNNLMQEDYQDMAAEALYDSIMAQLETN